MSQQILIGVSIIAALAVMVGIKTWLHNLVKFKMDESAILRYLQESAGSYQRLSAEAIAQGTGIDAGRVVRVCGRSKAVKSDIIAAEFWCAESP